MSKVIVPVGKKKTGKSTWIRGYLNGIDIPTPRKYVFDPNGEYSEFNQFPGDDIDAFLKAVYNVKNSVIVIEEATINFRSAKRQKELLSLCVRSREDHQNNLVLLVFHSWRTFPTWIFDQADALKVFKTNDTVRSMMKFEGVPKIEAAFKYCNYLTPSDLHASYFIDFYAEYNKQSDV